MMRKALRDVLLAALLLFGIAACTWTGIRSDSAIAQRVYVAGALHYGSPVRIARTAAPFLGVPFFDVDIKHMAEQIDDLPWPATVSIDRHWPDGVVIRVTEHQPIARWGANSVLTADFSVITPDEPVNLPDLPHLSGPEGTGKQVYAQFTTMNRKLATVGNKHIDRLVLNARGSWVATLGDGLELRFGREQVTTRLQRFINYALQRIPAVLAHAGYVDLRYGDGFAVGGTRTTAAAQENGNEQKA